MNILIVDNNAVWLETLKRGLNINGHEVVEAMSANEALMNLSNPDTPGINLVLSDYIMAEMNGIELLKEIRMNYGSLPVIIMTAYAESALLIEAFRNHCSSASQKF